MTGSQRLATPGTVTWPRPPRLMSAVLADVMTWKGYLIVSETPRPMGSIERSAHDGLQTVITDNARDGRFEATVGDQVIGRQPYRRYRGHIVLMATEIDPQWRGRGVSSALIDGVLGLIRSAGHTVVPRCKLTGDYLFRHPQYQDLVTDQYQTLVRPISRPGLRWDQWHWKRAGST